MHTFKVILAGFALLGVCLFAGRWLGGGGVGVAKGAVGFIPLWLGAALVNMWFGVTRAGYSISEELPVLVGVFAAPAAAALLIWLKMR
jgi:hypothetical protein